MMTRRQMRRRGACGIVVMVALSLVACADSASIGPQTTSVSKLNAAQQSKAARPTSVQRHATAGARVGTPGPETTQQPTRIA